jgi:uncharacterized protein YbjT (DUF2867 family)
MVETILVTGATGTVGSEVVKQLSGAMTDINIKAAVHSQNKAETLKQIDNQRLEFVDLDYAKPETIDEALNHVDKLFLLTLPTPNIADISSSLVKEAKKNGVKYIVKLSVMKANAEPGYALGRLHRQEEKIIEKSGISYTFLRPTSFMQNFVNFYGQTIKNQNAFYIHAGDAKVSFVDVRDIATVAVELLTKDGSQHQDKAYGITGQEALSYGQAAEIISKEIGRKISYIDIPEDYARKGMKEIGMDDWFIDVMMDGFNYIIRGDYGSQTTNAVEQVTGRKPISFAQFAKDYAETFR